MLNVCVCACGWKATSRPVVYNERLKHVAMILIESVGYSFTTLKDTLKKVIFSGGKSTLILNSSKSKTM